MTIDAQFMMLKNQHLLPPNATTLEKALSYSDRAVLDIPTPLEDLWRWDSCPSDLLPWLAWALKVDLWDPSWDDTKKRNVIRDSFAMHRLKGTLGGIRKYIDVAGSTLIKATRPPAKNYLGRSTTAAEKEAFLDTLPQIRIYPQQVGAFAGHRAFFGRPGHPRFFADQNGKPAAFPKVVSTADRLTTIADYVYNNVTTELQWANITIDGATGYERVMIPSTGYYGTFLGSSVQDGHRKNFIGSGFNGIGTGGKRFLHKSDAKDRIVTLDLNRTSAVDSLLYRFPVIPDLSPVNIVPFREYKPGFAPRSMFAGVPAGPSNAVAMPPDGVAPAPFAWGNLLLTWGNKALEWQQDVKATVPALPYTAPAKGRRFLAPSGAKYRVYDIVRLKPPSLPPNAGSQATNFMGRGRFGIKKYTAELLVEVPGKRSRWATSKFVNGFLVKRDPTNLDNAVFAAKVSKSARDTVLMNTKAYKPLQIGQVLTMGSDLTLGHYTRA